MKVEFNDKYTCYPDETFKYPRCPRSSIWFGYILYTNHTIEYNGQLYKNGQNEHKVKQDILKRIDDIACDFIGKVETYLWVDKIGNKMYSFNLVDKDGLGIRINRATNRLEVFDGSKFVSLSERRRQIASDKDKIEKQSNDMYKTPTMIDIDKKWKSVRTRVGRDKLLELITKIIDGKEKYNKADEIRDLKINFKEDGTYAVHKQLRE